MALRQIVYIDPDVQGALIGRVLIYTGIALTYCVVGACCMQYFESPDKAASEHLAALFEAYWPWLPSLLLLPLIVFDIVRLSNRFAGPIYRLSRHLRDLESNNACRPLAFRDGDYWQHLAPSINRLQLKMLQMEAELAVLRTEKATGSVKKAADDLAAKTQREAKKVEVRRKVETQNPMLAATPKTPTSDSGNSGTASVNNEATPEVSAKATSAVAESKPTVDSQSKPDSENKDASNPKDKASVEQVEAPDQSEPTSEVAHSDTDGAEETSEREELAAAT